MSTLNSNFFLSLTGTKPGPGTKNNNALENFKVLFSLSIFCYCVALCLKAKSIITLHSIPQLEKVKIANSYQRKEKKKNNCSSLVLQWLANSNVQVVSNWVFCSISNNWQTCLLQLSILTKNIFTLYCLPSAKAHF